MKNEKHISVVRLTSLALLAALIVVLQTVASGIKIGPVPISLTLVPIVVGAILFGPGAGAFLGGVFGVVCLIAGIAAELQTDGVIEKKFGRRIPIILADLETAWYMIEATQAANPNGEADAYLQACKRQAEQAEAMREMYANEIEELMKRRNR